MIPIHSDSCIARQTVARSEGLSLAISPCNQAICCCGHDGVIGVDDDLADLIRFRMRKSEYFSLSLAESCQVAISKAQPDCAM